MVSVGVGMIIIAALLLGSISLQRALNGGEQYATAQDSQLRAMDYITRDLRRAGGLVGCGALTVTAPDGTSVTFDATDYTTLRSNLSRNCDPIALGPNWLMAAVPDYYDTYDSKGNPTASANPLDPVIASGGSPVYGSVPPVVTYFVDSTTKSLIRQVNWKASGVAKQSQTVIADGVQNFQLTFATNGQYTLNWTFASMSARTATGSYAAADIGKIATQSDDGSYWLLSSVTGTSPNATPGWTAIGPPNGSVVGVTLKFAPKLQSNNNTQAREGTTLSAAVTCRNIPSI